MKYQYFRTLAIQVFIEVLIFRTAIHGIATQMTRLPKMKMVKMSSVYGVAKEVLLSPVINAVTQFVMTALNRIWVKKPCHVYVVKVGVY